MSSLLVELLVGVALGVASVAAARSLGTVGDRVLGAAVISLPLIYAGFKLADGEVGHAGLELLVGLPFLAAGVWLLRPGAPGLWLGVAWLAHGAFDGVRHLVLSDAGIPSWYPAVCAGVDVAVGVLVLWRVRRSRA